jgi:hypothetical protein
MTLDLWEKAETELAKTFFYSPGMQNLNKFHFVENLIFFKILAGNVCFTGHCSYYCDTTHAICGRPKDRMEGSVQLMLPSKPLVKWKIVSHPYRRSYNKKKKAEWEINQNYCNEKGIFFLLFDFVITFVSLSLAPDGNISLCCREKLFSRS